MNINRCPECGGVAGYYATDIEGRNYYKCMTGLTTLGQDMAIEPCDTIINDKRKVFSGVIAFVTNNNIKTLVVASGKERR